MRHLNANLGGAFWNPEGVGYLSYPFEFTSVFAVAARRAGLGDLVQEVPGYRDTGLVPYLASAPIPTRDRQRGICVDLSDDNPGQCFNGGAGAVFGVLAGDDRRLAALRWCYDRWEGALGSGHYDAGRGGVLYSLLWYPETIEPLDPSAVFGRALVDRIHGIGLCRNAWDGEHDCVVALNACSRRPHGGHAGPDTNALRIIGLGAVFVVGGGRTGRTAGQSNLFPGEPPPRGDRGRGVLEFARTEINGSATAAAAWECARTGAAARLITGIPSHSRGDQRRE
ncbi:MAG: hypothetical protein PF961_01940 [Planctomycetota bacterium]|nr:hypothetical protein [Planctomycetota bacterium]